MFLIVIRFKSFLTNIRQVMNVSHGTVTVLCFFLNQIEFNVSKYLLLGLKQQSAFLISGVTN